MLCVGSSLDVTVQAQSLSKAGKVAELSLIMSTNYHPRFRNHIIKKIMLCLVYSTVLAFAAWPKATGLSSRFPTATQSLVRHGFLKMSDRVVVSAAAYVESSPADAYSVLAAPKNWGDLLLGCATAAIVNGGEKGLVTPGAKVREFAGLVEPIGAEIFWETRVADAQAGKLELIAVNYPGPAADVTLSLAVTNDAGSSGSKVQVDISFVKGEGPAAEVVGPALQAEISLSTALLFPYRLTPAGKLPSVFLGFGSKGMGLLKSLFTAEAEWQADVVGNEEARATASAQLDEEVGSAPVVLYTYGLSPFSTEALAFLDATGAKYKKVEVGLEWFLLGPTASCLRAELLKRTGQSSLPHVYIGGKSVGGLYSGTPGLVELQKTGGLVPMLEQAGAL